MRLNSKLPIVVTLLAIGIFSFISSEDDNLPKLKTISGSLNELQDINIKIHDSSTSKYLNYKYDINKENTHKKTSIKKEDPSYRQEYMELLDVTNEENLVAHVGYEVDYSGDKNKISLVIDRYKDEKYKSEVVDYTNSNDNNYIMEEEANKRNIDRVKKEIDSPIKYDNVHVRTLDSIIYNNEIYLVSYYYHSDPNNMDGIVEVSKIDYENNTTHIIKSINLYEEFKDSSRVDAWFTHKQDNNIYIVISSNKEGKNYNEELRGLYILNYDISKNNYVINEVDMPDESYLLHTKLYNNSLNMTFGIGNTDVGVISFDYDLKTNKIKNKFTTTLESYKEIADRMIADTISDEEKIYLVVSDNAHYDYSQPKADTSIYVIDKESKEITYEGLINKQLLKNTQIKLEYIEQ